MGLFDIFSSENAEQAANIQRAALAQGLANYGNYAERARSALTDFGAKAVAPWESLGPGTEAAYKQYLDITGAGGPEGQARARALFQADPGAAYEQEEAQKVLERGGIAGGFATGNIIDQITRDAQNRARTNYGNWADRAYRAAAFAPTVAGGTSGVYGQIGAGLANLYSGQGAAELNTAKAQGDAAAAAAMDANRASGQIWTTLGQGAMAAATIL
jgi:hypothetical protein